VGTLDDADSGEVILFGKNASQLNSDDRATLRAREIGFIFQLHHLLPQSTVLENVLIPRLARGAGGVNTEVEERASALLDRVGMAEHRTKFPSQLSGGERQRVAVVRALINQPRLLLADEPTGSLDGESAGALMDLLIELNEEAGTALILVTHNLQQAARIGKCFRLDHGKLVESAP
jgi:predicted ABC-type transport system involved in lysophospholipase L1 biosynthesis ATPase subunit